MLVCIAGFPGSGRNRLAVDLSKSLGYHYHDVRYIKRAEPIRMLHNMHRQIVGEPYSDELLTLSYKRLVDELPIMSKMYPDMVVRDHFIREQPREYFFTEAEKYFDTLRLVWVDANEGESNHCIEEALKDNELKIKRKSLLNKNMRDVFQPFTRDYLSVHYLEDPHKALDDVLAYVAKR